MVRMQILYRNKQYFAITDITPLYIYLPFTCSCFWFSSLTARLATAVLMPLRTVAEGGWAEEEEEDDGDAPAWWPLLSCHAML